MINVRRDSGFSLVEMMVVVAIVGLLTSVVILVVPSKSNGLQRDINLTQQALVALSRNSVITGRILGVRFDPAGFDVVSLSDDGWVAENTVIKTDARRWNASELASLTVDGIKLDPVSETARPHVWFLPSGEYPAFELHLSDQSRMASVLVSASGKFRVAVDE